MSYCRFGWQGSEVYVYEGSDGIVCCGCQLDTTKSSSFVCETSEEMIAHLGEHRRANQYVPNGVIEELWDEIPGALRPTRPEKPFFSRTTLVMQMFMILAEYKRLGSDPEDKGMSVETLERELRKEGIERPAAEVRAEYDGVLPEPDPHIVQTRRLGL